MARCRETIKLMEDETYCRRIVHCDGQEGHECDHKATLGPKSHVQWNGDHASLSATGAWASWGVDPEWSEGRTEL